MESSPVLLEFFAGGGMARAGLGPRWTCAFANDFSSLKASTYRANWGDNHFFEGDIANVSADQLPGRADVSWASFPCQDLSLAGNYKGLGDEVSGAQTRSGTFWAFWRLMTKLRKEARPPKIIVLENVVGAISSREGRDFSEICRVLAEADYRFGAMVVDAKHFVPQSRPRLFFVAVASDLDVPVQLTRVGPTAMWHPPTLAAAELRLPNDVRSNWIWWGMPNPPTRDIGFADIIEDDPKGCRWHTQAETQQLLAMMTPLHLQKIEQAKLRGTLCVGGVYKRTRLDAEGRKRQRAEVRFDDIAGCLRTPAGGSSRQLIVVIKGESIRSRLLSPREAARLMGLSDDYHLPDRYNDAYQVAGDGVCVPVVRYISEMILEPILGLSKFNIEAVAA